MRSEGEDRHLLWTLRPGFERHLVIFFQQFIIQPELVFLSNLNLLHRLCVMPEVGARVNVGFG